MGVGIYKSTLHCSSLTSALAQITGKNFYSDDSVWVAHLGKLQLLYYLSYTLSVLRNAAMRAYQFPSLINESNSGDQVCRSDEL